ncbi:VOC family protein [Comamonas sediminis]|uniref:VOC family protein n=1 Tax=Comamonas sediminis TaxID=1783360 RepID=A0ABV4AXG0_9BURK
MTIALTTLLIYAKDMQRTARFYVEHFGYASDCKVVDGLISLQPLHGGAEILIHQAAKSLKFGSAVLKLSFSVADVEQFVAQAAAKGLAFGSLHQAHGYAFANTKDPDGNSISVSSRQYRTT